MPRAYVLLSGGIDSSVCLAVANEEHDGMVCAVTISYGQRHKNEVEHACKIVRHYELALVHKDLTEIIGTGGLTDPNLVIPHKSYAELPEGVSPTYVPFRNGLFLSLLASIASADPEAVEIYYGAHAEDAERDAYPDCSTPFIKAMTRAIDIGTYGRNKLKVPFAKSTKVQVIRRGENLGVPWELTWSCYEGGDEHCGNCPTCIARRDAFIGARVVDPTTYKDTDI